MINKDDQSQIPSLPSEPEVEFVRLQLEQALETYRTQFSLMIQVATVLVIADVTIVGYAISARIAGILLIGAIFPTIILGIMHSAGKWMLPIIYNAVSLESKYGGANIDWLASTLLSTIVSTEYVDRLRSISSIRNADERIAQLRRVPEPLLGIRSKTRLTLILIAIGQVIAPAILSLVFGWRLF